MICPKCGSANVNFQAVADTRTKKKGCAYWLFVGWWLELFLWLFLTVPMLLFKLFGGKGKVKTKIRTMAVCQNCGNRWET